MEMVDLVLMEVANAVKHSVPKDFKSRIIRVLEKEKAVLDEPQGENKNYLDFSGY